MCEQKGHRVEQNSFVPRLSFGIALPADRHKRLCSTHFLARRSLRFAQLFSSSSCRSHLNADGLAVGWINRVGNLDEDGLVFRKLGLFASGQFVVHRAGRVRREPVSAVRVGRRPLGLTLIEEAKDEEEGSEEKNAGEHTETVLLLLLMGEHIYIQNIQNIQNIHQPKFFHPPQGKCQFILYFTS